MTRFRHRQQMQHAGHSAGVGRGKASIVRHSLVGSTRVILSERGTKDSKVEDADLSTMDVNPCVSPIQPSGTRSSARKVRENPEWFFRIVRAGH
jgi:hypothetical protein